MMKKKCIKSDSEKTTSIIPTTTTTPDDIPPNTTVVNVPYNSLPVSFQIGEILIMSSALICNFCDICNYF